MTERRLPLALGNTGNPTFDADQNDLIQKGANGLWFSRGPGEIIIPGRLLRRKIYTSGVSLGHTLTSTTTFFRVIGQAPGGGSGGVDGQGANTTAISSGGGAGAYFEHLFTVNAGFVLGYTVGQGGAGGASGNNAGLPGTAPTSVIYNSLTLEAGPGDGGSGDLGTTTEPRCSPRAQGNIITTGAGFIVPDIGVRGGDSYPAIILSIAQEIATLGTGVINSVGGRSRLGMSGLTVGAVATAGVLGSGGSGLNRTNSSSNSAGAAGGNGILIIEEYSDITVV